VLRLAPGGKLTLFDGGAREALAEVAQVDAQRATLQVGEPARVPEPPRPPLTVLLSLIKGDRTEWALQKLVELGVDRIVPVQAARSVVRLTGRRADDRRNRYDAVARAAAQQCRRPTLPEVAPIQPLDRAIHDLAPGALKLLLWERERSRSLASALPASTPDQVAVLIGPEGGFDPGEVDRARTAGFVAIGLGPRVLRAETAAVAIVAVLGYLLGDLKGN